MSYISSLTFTKTQVLTFDLGGVTGEGQNLLAEVFPLVNAKVGITGEQSARLQVSTESVKESHWQRYMMTSHPGRVKDTPPSSAAVSDTGPSAFVCV